MMEDHDYSCLSRKSFEEQSKAVDEGISAADSTTLHAKTETNYAAKKPLRPAAKEQVPVEAKVDTTTMLPTSSEENEQVQSRLLSDTAQLIGKAADTSDEEVGEYYFETDHLALRGNADYMALLKAIVVLEAQRTKAIQDLEQLMQCQEAAMADPIAFVEKLQNNENLNLPKPQKVANLPAIDWDHYMACFNPMALNRARRTRRKQQPIEKPTKIAAVEPTPVVEPVVQTILAAARASPRLCQNSSEGRSETFNQPWSAEEQKRLEELLVKHPPEEVESRRWEKIAQALGNRTRQQVASRVQKYFIKLTKAGLPVPGRTPNISNYMKRGHSHRHQRHNRYLFQPSTFFASYDPPVYMCDDDDTMSSCNVSTTSSIDGDANDKLDFMSEDETIPSELRDSDEYKEMLALMKLKKEKLQVSGLVQHAGFKCNRCECEPIVGTRWHCIDCSLENVDFCDECADSMHETATHSSSHRLQPISVVTRKSYVDGDYTTFLPGDYNYLDPNYMPAT